MIRQKDLLIVGAGAIGLSLADVCLRAGLSVTVLDKGGVAREASWAGAGMLTCRPRLKHDPARPDYYDLALRSVRLHAEWAETLKEETGLDTGYRVCGALEISRPHPAPTAMPAELAEEETSGRRRQKHHIQEQHRRMDRALHGARHSCALGRREPSARFGTESLPATWPGGLIFRMRRRFAIPGLRERSKRLSGCAAASCAPAWLWPISFLMRIRSLSLEW